LPYPPPNFLPSTISFLFIPSSSLCFLLSPVVLLLYGRLTFYTCRFFDFFPNSFINCFFLPPIFAGFLVSPYFPPLLSGTPFRLRPEPFLDKRIWKRPLSFIPLSYFSFIHRPSFPLFILEKRTSFFFYVNFFP